MVRAHLADEDIVRVILDGTVIKTRIDKRATNISVLAAIPCPAGPCAAWSREGRVP